MSNRYEKLQNRIDEDSLARKMFQVEDLPNNCLPLYNKLPKAAAFVMGEEGDRILMINSTTTKVITPFYDLPRPQLLEQYPSDFSVADVAKSYIRSEEERAFALLQAAITQKPLLSDDGIGYIDISTTKENAIYSAIKEIEGNDLPVSTIILHPSKIDQWPFDLEVDTTLSLTTHKGTWDGYAVYAHPSANPSHVSVLAEKEFLGRIPIKTKVSLTEELTEGMLIFNLPGISAISS